MGASIEHQLLCKIVETQDFGTIQKLGINENFFLGDPSEYKEIFRYLSRHFHDPVTWGSVPSWQIVTSNYPGLAWVGTFDTLPTLCEELRKAKLRSQLVSLADEIVTRADLDPKAALESVKEASVRLIVEHERSNDAILANAHDMLLEEYQTVQAGGGLTGIPWPWQILNDDTQGIHNEEYILIFGRPKSMKSWIALHTASLAYYLHRQRVLIYSLEMSRIQCLRRIACCLAGVDYEKYKKAQLDPATFARVFELLKYLAAQEEYYRNDKTGRQPALIVSTPSDDGEGGGVQSLHAKIREFEPTLVVVDAMYLMKDDREKKRTIDWKAVTHISQDLKRTAQKFKVPLIATTQANRTAKNPNDKEADLAELAYADALAQDCDLAMRVHKQKLKDGDTELVISIPGSREGKLDIFVIHGQPAVNFAFKRLTVKDPNAPEEPEDQGKNGHSRRQSNGTPPSSRQQPVIPNWRTGT
jgi:replicative DNA helicase